MGNTKSIGVAYSDQDLDGSTITNPNFVLSGLAAASTPLASSDTLSVVQGSTTKRATVESLFTALNYGMFQDNTTQTNGGATTANVMTYNTTDFANGISVVSNSRLTVSRTGVYNIQFSSQFSRAGGAGFSTIDVWLSKNGSNVAETNTQLNVPQSGGKAVAAWNYLAQATVGDYFELYWASSDTAVEMWSSAAGTNPTRPVTPSVIVTITQVG
jgi:hypothetical protein